MKKLLLIAGIVTAFAQSAIAGPLGKLPDPKAPKEAVNVAPEEAFRWSIGAGVIFREIESDFHLHSPGPLNPSYPRRASRGRGDVGFFSGGSGSVGYDDGRVGPELFPGEGDGLAAGQINSSSQLANRRPLTIFGVPAGADLYDVSFHSSLTSYSYASTYSPRSFASSDEETGVGPYIELRYAAFAGPHVDVNVVFGYSWVGVDLGSGTGLLATQSIQETQTNRRYSYTYDFGVDPGAGNLTFPHTVDQNSPSAILYNKAAFDGFGQPVTTNVQDPRKSVHTTRSTRTVAEFYAVGSANLDVDLHELVLGPEISARLGDRVHVGLTVGPTLNFINTDFDSEAAWYAKGSNKALKTYHYHDSGTETKVGVAAQVTLQVDLTARLFIQGSGSYRYVEDFGVSAGFAHANVDVTGWQGAVGFGIRL